MDITAESEMKITFAAGYVGLGEGVASQSYYDGEALRLLLSGAKTSPPTSISLTSKEEVLVGLER